MRSLRHAVAHPKSLKSRIAVPLVGLVLVSVVSLARPAQAGVGGGAYKPGSDLDPVAEDGGPKLPTTGVLWGASADRINVGEGTGQAAHLLFEELVGRKLAVKRTYHLWDEVFPDDLDEWVRDRGTTIMTSWQSSRDGVPEAYWRDIAAGQHDALIDARAADVKAFGAPMFFTFHHEPDTGDPDTGTAAEFVAAWQHVHDRFEAAGVTNVSWMLVLMAYTYNSDGADAWYPGDEYVDIIGADGYNWFTCPPGDGDWMTFEQRFGGFYDYGVAQGKPMAIGEYGTLEDPAQPDRKGEWFDEASAVLKTWPEIKALSYYNNGVNAGGNCDWWIDSSDASLEGFSGMGADPYFNPPPPLVEVTASPADPSNSPVATFEFTSNLPGSTFTCKLDAGAALPCVSPHIVAGLTQKEHTATITATDPVSGLRSSVVHRWAVDVTAPQLDITFGPSEFTTESDAFFSVWTDEQDPTTTLQCALDGSLPSECVVPITYEGLGQGVHTFESTATDAAGNVSVPAVWIWTVDTTAPTVTIATGPAALTKSKSATFTMSSNEVGSTFKCSLDGGSYFACASPKTYNWLSDGAHSFSAKALDPAKNESAPKSWTWTVDATRPTVTITSGPAEGPSSSVTFQFTASEGNVTFKCQLDAATPTTCTSPKTYANVAVGVHTFKVYATDLAGNVGKTVKWTWRRT